MKIVITWFDHLVSCHLSSTDESDNEKTKKQRTNETPFTMSRMGGQNINIYMTFQLILAHLKAQSFQLKLKCNLVICHKPLPKKTRYMDKIISSWAYSKK